MHNTGGATVERLAKQHPQKKKGLVCRYG